MATLNAIRFQKELLRNYFTTQELKAALDEALPLQPCCKMFFKRELFYTVWGMRGGENKRKELEEEKAIWGHSDHLFGISVKTEFIEFEYNERRRKG